jgi:hypothetical protein
MPPARRGNTIYKRNDARLTEIPYETLSDTLLSLDVARSWISEIDCARLPKSTTRINATECPFLARVLNLDQLPNLTNLYLPGCNSLRSLPSLPNSLKDLSVWSCPGLTSLPPLRRTSLEYLNVCDTVLRTLPELPDTIREIRANYSKLETLPFLPDSLVLIATLGISPTDSIPTCPIGVYIDEYLDALRTKQRKALRKSRYDALFEELMMAAWRPDRVSKWLEAGEDVLDMMMGV